jgi:hypothetical protein
VEVHAEPGDVWFFSLIRWGDEFWSQGMSTEGLSLEDNTEVEGKGIPQLLMTPEEHQKWLDLPRLHERKFLEFLGDHMCIFPTPKEAYAAQAKVYQATSEEILGKPAKELPLIPQEGFDSNKPLALYFVPGQGIAYCPYTPIIIDFLQHPETSTHTANAITNTLFRQVTPFGVDYILSHYPTDSLEWKGFAIDVVKNAKFLTTYFQPEEAGPPLPWISFVNTKLREE